LSAILKHEPTQIRAGDTWQWRREDLATNYPAPTWTLSYVFKNAVKAFGFNAAADGSFFAISVGATETTDYPAGFYRWAAQVASGDERHTVGMGTTEVLASVFDSPETPADLRSHNQICLDNIRAVLEKRATLDQMRYEIANRSLERTPIKDLLMLRDDYAAAVARDADAELPPGQRRGRNAYVRFGPRAV
jgi:hypothetical protein